MSAILAERGRFVKREFFSPLFQNSVAEIYFGGFYKSTLMQQEPCVIIGSTNLLLKGNIGMKKTSFIIVIIIVIVSAISIHLITSPKVLGNMSKSYSEQITTTSDISFSGEAGDRIKFSFKSDIISGNLDMVLYDSVENEVYTLDNAKALETFFTLERSDTYTLAAKCSNFIGDYKIVIYSMSD